MGTFDYGCFCKKFTLTLIMPSSKKKSSFQIVFKYPIEKCCYFELCFFSEDDKYFHNIVIFTTSQIIFSFYIYIQFCRRLYLNIL